MPAYAASKDFGARSCGTTWVVQTVTYSSGTTVHVQIGSSTKTWTFSNGDNIIHRYYSAGLSSVSASSATTTGSFSGGSSENYVTCTS